MADGGHICQGPEFLGGGEEGWRFCDNKIVIVLSKGKCAILKMTAFQPYLSMDQNNFRADTSRHSEECMCKILMKFLHWISEETR